MKPVASDNLEIGHHHHVLVLQVVAVEHIASPVAGETDEHTDLLAGGEIHGILPSRVFGQRFPVVAGEHLETYEMEVDGVRGRSSPEVPDLGGTHLRTGGHTPGIERFAVDTPHRPSLVAHPREAKLARALGFGLREPVELRHVRESLWNHALFILFVGDAEAHNFGGSALAHTVLERNLVADAVLGEVYDHVEALRLRDGDRAVPDRRAQQTTVATNLNEGCVP